MTASRQRLLEVAEHAALIKNEGFIVWGGRA
jgi:hypothetical protein